MKRSAFVKALTAAGLVALSPFSATARSKRVEKGIFVPSGKDRHNNPLTRQPGDIIYNKVSTADSDGDLYIFDTTRVKEGGPPLHFHYDQDEWWYVISGEFLIRVGDETYHAKPGDSVYGPRRVPHCFAKIGEGEAKIILLFQPAGKMEEFFIAVNEGRVAKMSEAEKEQFRKDCGFEHVGPPIEIPKKEK
jgi:mannose-6-phosphate isomerase-like protein (cupin superfamily)